MKRQNQIITAPNPEGDEVIIYNLEDAAKFYWNFRIKDGSVVSMYINNEKVKKLFQKKDTIITIAGKDPNSLKLQELVRTLAKKGEAEEEEEEDS